MELISSIYVPKHRVEDFGKFCISKKIDYYFHKSGYKLYADVSGKNNDIYLLCEKLNNWKEEDRKKSLKYKILKKFNLIEQ